ncbi:hypothetical protein [Methylophaga nitratireducenticrescens]|uniref:hypothetical protein n=1 Tax=Methylophaga nitratireducenticrescens TaxID=754476 RepID=UPI000CDCABF1|nr:hypothetical protein [Methylophaga nitratireducenticrescens]AUZ85859.1 hypothetical protein CDW43_15360 [Methylophaga nitratireducenticrescens]
MPKPLVEQKWYLQDLPWCHSDDAGMTILAGDPDPQKGVPVADTQDLMSEYYNDDLGRELAAHIVELHNANLKAK